MKMCADRDSHYVRSVQLLVVAPSHELALQIANQCRWFSTLGLDCVCMIGATNIERQFDQLKAKRPQIIVGTPGRLAEAIIDKRGRRLAVTLLKTVIVDEADRCLAGVHANDTLRLLSFLRDQELSSKAISRHYVFVSATGDHVNVLETAAKYTTGQPFLLQVHHQGAGPGIVLPQNLRHFYTICPARLRLDIVRKLTFAMTRLLSINVDPYQDALTSQMVNEMCGMEISNSDVASTIVFVPDQRTADIYAERLDARGVYAAALSGKIENRDGQSVKLDRAQVMDAFRRERIRVLVTTELVARGLDFPQVGLIVNLGGLPTDAAHYAHRAGRAGRMGRRGYVVTVADDPGELSILQRLANDANVTLKEIVVSDGVVQWETTTDLDLPQLQSTNDAKLDEKP